MTTSRPLRDVLGEQAEQLSQDRRATLEEAGHPDLPEALVAEAVVSYADTAPHPVAEHLAPFVTAHHAARHGEPAGPEAELSHGLHLLASAPSGSDIGAPGEGDAAVVADIDLDQLAPEHGAPEPADAFAAGDAGGPEDQADLLVAPEFGGGAAEDAHGSPGGLTAEEGGPPPETGGTGDEQLPVGPENPFVDAVDESVAAGSEPDGSHLDGSDPDGDDIVGL
jgi:hypothetical protein